MQLADSTDLADGTEDTFDPHARSVYTSDIHNQGLATPGSAPHDTRCRRASRPEASPIDRTSEAPGVVSSSPTRRCARIAVASDRGRPNSPASSSRHPPEGEWWRYGSP